MLRVTDKGHRSYAVRTRINGQQVRKTLGDVTTLDLAEARELARDVLKFAARGIDILEQRKRDARATADAATAAERLEWTKIRAEFVDDYAKPNQRQWEETERILKRHVDPEWKGRLLTDIDRDDVLELIHKVKKRSGVYMANRTLAHVRKLFNWAALQPKMLKSVPIVRGMQQKGEKARDRVLTDEELRDLWGAAGTLPTPFRQYIQLLMLTGQRAGEIKNLELPEINAADSLIEFSGAKYKNGRPHIVPITPMVAAIVATLPQFEKCSFVVTTTGTVAIDCDTYLKEKIVDAVRKARREAIEDAGGNPDDAKPMPDWRLHDIRRTMRTGLSKLGIASDIGERVMGHVIGGVRGVYDRYDYLEQKRAALGAWERYLCRIVGLAGGDNVIDMVRAIGEPNVTRRRPAAKSRRQAQPKVASVQ
jgi:integrase